MGDDVFELSFRGVAAMKCEYGFCSVCEKEIAKRCNDCGSRKPGNEYTEVEVEWSNGSKMKIAVCVTCATTHVWTTPEAKAGLTKAHQDYWDKAKGTYDKAVVIV